jgi:hypothetical protein
MADVRRKNYENMQLLSSLLVQAPCPKGAVNVSVVPFPSAVCSMMEVNFPSTGLVNVRVTG